MTRRKLFYGSFLKNKQTTVQSLTKKLYYNKLTEGLFCLAEQQNNCLSKKVMFISVCIYIYRYFCLK